MFELPINLVTFEPQMKFFAPTWMQWPEDLKNKFFSLDLFFLLVAIFKMVFKKSGVLRILHRNVGKQNGKVT